MTSNQLINEKSPYLLQHAHNPVNWHPWSDAAFEKARAEDKPVFLSIGYATCHWCHVMEKETFEDEEAAQYMNDTFICVKVDREERPDIDAVYMTACQIFTGRGGWPLTLFITPDKKPFFAATYLPKHSRAGTPGIIELCQQIKKLWITQQDRVINSAVSVADTLNNAFSYKSADRINASVLTQAYNGLEQSFDARFGGFESTPKFPTPHRLLFLLHCYFRTGNDRALDMVKKTLTAMRLGGIWDHAGFGFHRYSTDKYWLLPHFEKMLYDQALLAIAYLETYQITKDTFYADTAEEIFAYVLRDMTSDDGGFFAAEDADSEGEEGKFYVWTLKEFRQVLGETEAQQWENIFNLTDDGNFFEEATGRKTGTNILYLSLPLSEWAGKSGMAENEFALQWEDARKKLFDARKQRIHPLKDDKILTDWNGLMIAALAIGARYLNKNEYLEAAQKAAQFILSNLCKKTLVSAFKQDSEVYSQVSKITLFHRFRDSEAAITAHADDYAFFIMGLLELYRTTFDLSYLEQAVSFQDQMFKDYWDDENSGFFLTSAETDELPVRPKELYDGATPSANSVSITNLIRLARLTGDTKWENRSFDLVTAFSGTVGVNPSLYTCFLSGTDLILQPGQEVIVVGEADAPDTKEMLSALNQDFSPNQVVMLKTKQNAEQLGHIADYTKALIPIKGKATAYVCANFSCNIPTTDVETMRKQIQEKK